MSEFAHLKYPCYVHISLVEPTTVQPSTDTSTTTTTTTSASAPNCTSYSFRNRASLKRPTAFPVAFSPRRTRSAKHVRKGYKNMATVTMPVKKVKKDGVNKDKSLSVEMTAEQKAASRAASREARRLAKETRVAKAVQGGC